MYSTSSAAVRNLLSRVEQLEGELARKNGTSPAFSPRGSTDMALSGSSEQSAISLHSPRSTNHHSQTLSPLGGVQSHTELKTSQRSLGRFLGKKWFRRGLPILSPKGREWVCARTGQENILEKFGLFSPATDYLTTAPPQAARLSTPQRLPEEPSIRLMASMLRLPRYCDVASPILEGNLFDVVIAMVYETSNHTSENCSRLAARAYMLALHAMANLLNEDVQNLDALSDAQSFAEEAQSYLGHLIGEVSLVSLHVVLLLVRITSMENVPPFIHILNLSLSTEILPRVSG